MAKSFERNEVPSAYSIKNFSYMGKAASEQDDFSSAIGIADMIQFDLDSDDETTEYFKGAACSYYHAGVLQYKDDDTWWVYLEWGRVNNATYSWKVTKKKETFQLSETSDFIFRICDDEADARKYFKGKCQEKNIKRIKKSTVGKAKIWIPKGTKRGYIVQELAQRMRGLPDAYTKTQKTKAKSTRSKDPVLQFAHDMSGGSLQFAQKLIEDGGSIPTLEGIEIVQNELIPAALRLINKISPPTKRKRTKKQLQAALRKQLNDKNLVMLSEYAATFVPRPIPLNLSQIERKKIVCLTQDNITTLEHDLDVFKNLLLNNTTTSMDVDSVFGADLEWISLRSNLGKWLKQTLDQMTNNRHFRSGMTISNIFAVHRPKWDRNFIRSVKKVAKKRKGSFSAHATLQPQSRPDMDDYNGADSQANVYLGIHGTRAVNVMPIIRNNLQLPQLISGGVRTGVDFGYGIYFATDWKKSYGYVGADDSYYRRPGSEGRIPGRNVFLLLSDVIMGEPYQATGTGSWTKPPKNCDSIAMFPRNISTLGNDEYTIFDQDYQRIRYIIEFSRS